MFFFAADNDGEKCLRKSFDMLSVKNRVHHL